MKQYSNHKIADVYPMMSDKELQALISSMEVDGYDESQPIYLFEDKILDGRNRYKAAQEAGVEPAFKVFEGTYEEAEKKSILLNSNRRHMSTSQKAMIAAMEIQKSRDDTGRKKITIPKASIIYAVSPRSISEALQILQEDESIAKLVFDGKCNLKGAKFKIEEIERIKNPPKEIDEQFSSQQQQERNSVLDNALTNADNQYESIQVNMPNNSVIVELQEKLRKCMEEKQMLLGNMAS
ncbi:hypothetical protein [Sulfurimonas sp. NW9]|uniref:hypothetical protein n=1 Tax=Sulfurimonas sp. NW9 TaxID=2922728 RepID=UPI003DA9110B